MLRLLGEDPAREGRLKTPNGSRRPLRFLTQGYEQDPCALLTSALSPRPTTRWSSSRTSTSTACASTTCCPFVARRTSPTCPRARSSPLEDPALWSTSSRTALQVQERLTTQIAETLHDCVKPEAVAVVIEAMHFCMMMPPQRREAELRLRHLLHAWAPSAEQPQTLRGVPLPDPQEVAAVRRHPGTTTAERIPVVRTAECGIRYP